MKRQINSAIFLFAAAMILAFGCVSCSTGRVEAPARLDGSWDCMSGVVDGKRLPEDSIRMLQLSFSGNQCRSQLGTQTVFASTYSTDLAKHPNQINIMGTEGDLTGKEAQGIFLIQDDMLLMCYTLPGHPRPAKFESLSGTDAYLLIWSRHHLQP